ncbi:MAG: efflux RND transporter permease subunit [Pseudomonadota bacterium]
METLTFRNPRIVALALLVILSAGISAFFALGRQEDPTITNLNAVITTIYPGATPARVEALVTKPIEDEMRALPEVAVITSTSSTGVSIVRLELDETIDAGVIEQVWSEARDAVEDAATAFPSGVRSPDFNGDGIAAFGAIVALRPSGDTVRPAVLGRYAEDLSERLRNVVGTEQVEQFGRPDEEILVTLDGERIAAMGLTPRAVADAIAAADAKVQSGRLFNAETDLVLDVAGDVETLDRLREIVLAEAPGAQVTRLDDVAEIARAVVTPRASYAISDGKDAVLIGAEVSEGQQVDIWMGRVRTALAAYDEALPASLEMELFFDQSAYTRDRLTEVGINMAIGVGLVVAILFLTLGWRAALIVAGVLPLVSLATIASMNIIGLPIHQMSVTGLIVALGLLVDAAIVMTDEIRQRLLKGMARVQAVGEAVRRLAAPLLASTVTTALSFVPMILLPGPAGDFVGAIAIAVVLMLIWSLVIALTITPAIAGWSLAASRGGGLPSGLPGRIFRGSLGWSVRNPVRSIALALILPVMGFLSFPTLTAQFFPGVDRDQFHIEVELARGTGIEHTRETALSMDALLRTTVGIENVAWTVGESAPAFYYNIVGSREGEPSFAQALVTTSSPDTTAALLTPLQTRLNTTFPEARILVRGLVQGPPVDAPVELRLVGPDLETLRAKGDEARGILLGLDPVTIVRTDLEGGAPKIDVTVDEDAARLLGLDLGQVAAQLRAATDGATGGALVEATEQLPVRVRFGDVARGDMAALRATPILPPDASAQAAAGTFPVLPLAAIADLQVVPSESPIVRRDGERVNTVQAFLRPEVLPEEALALARAALEAANFELPTGYRLEIGGDADARSDTVTNLLASLGLIVTLSIAAIVLTFNSVRLSAVTFLVAILSAGLSFLSLAVMNYPFGITAIIGVIGSIGVSINAAIIILTGLQARPDAVHGDTEAMADVVMGSSRHILSTTLTTFGGFLPLIVGGGGFWPPFAMAIAGGVLLSTVVSFYFTPAMFALIRRRGPVAETEDARFEDADPVPAGALHLAAE